MNFYIYTLNDGKYLTNCQYRTEEDFRSWYPDALTWKPLKIQEWLTPTQREIQVKFNDDLVLILAKVYAGSETFLEIIQGDLSQAHKELVEDTSGMEVIQVY